MFDVVDPSDSSNSPFEFVGRFFKNMMRNEPISDDEEFGDSIPYQDPMVEMPQSQQFELLDSMYEMRREYDKTIESKLPDI